MVVDNIRYSHCNVLNFSCEKQIALNMIFFSKANNNKKIPNKIFLSYPAASKPWEHK